MGKNNFNLYIIVTIIFCLLFFAFLHTNLKIDPRITSSLIAIFGAIIGGIIAIRNIVFSQENQKRIELENSLRDEKIEVFKKFIYLLQLTFEHSKNNVQIEKLSHEIANDIIIWGDTNLINKYLDLINSSDFIKNKSPEDINYKRTLKHIDDVLQQFKKIVDNKSFIKQYDLLLLLLANNKKFFEIKKNIRN